MKRKALKQHYMGLGVSDHALVRYLQRVKGINIDALKEVQKTAQIGHQCQFCSDSSVGLNRTVVSEMIRTLSGKNRHFIFV